MDQVIRWLYQGITSQTKEEKKFIEEHPLKIPTDDEKLREAANILLQIEGGGGR